MKKVILAVLCALCTTAALAQDAKRGWQVEIKKLAFDLTSTEVQNAQDYQGFSDARLTSDSQTAVRGSWDSIADYHAEHFLWNNELTMDYGRTKIRPVNGETLTNENADKILFTTGYTQRLWHVDDFLGGFEAGPFANIGYETEFTKPDNAPRTRILRAMAGAKLFEGKYLKSLYAAIVGERDFTYEPYASKLAWETGFKLELPVREGVIFKWDAMYRDYLDTTETHPTDLDWEFETNARLDVQVYKNLYVAPFVSYYTAQGKYIGPRGENVYIGVSVSFSHIFHAAK
ncbi:hypothetical protein [Candidatus Avelusimicrobium luingense]|uniref:hypothetical protein n=1 Tax=Candidatus Avelusimicrobium luingense TaxID=3416211 RepID=UPI003D150FAB